MAGVIFSKSLGSFFASQQANYLNSDIEIERLINYAKTSLKNGSQRNEHEYLMDLLDSDDLTHIVTPDPKAVDIRKFEKAGFYSLNTQKS
ncbi:hypothetical protein L1D54_07230 [Vibrio brasiliensis]|uniref:hypothetical protein n=1 Tax=Vibrio brasiliensis TaxID=170652 RepID=UPI001EFC4383|nr:hypothetical protein [Vibrio brasiliensis]MCG9750268.1 hypothetical protein [Vibrio brasiliensis]